MVNSITHRKPDKFQENRPHSSDPSSYWLGGTNSNMTQGVTIQSTGVHRAVLNSENAPPTAANLSHEFKSQGIFVEWGGLNRLFSSLNTWLNSLEETSSSPDLAISQPEPTTEEEGSFDASRWGWGGIIVGSVLIIAIAAVTMATTQSADMITVVVDCLEPIGEAIISTVTGLFMLYRKSRGDTFETPIINLNRKNKRWLTAFDGPFFEPLDKLPLKWRHLIRH